MLRAELVTGTPCPIIACRRSSRRVIASKLPAPTARTKAKSGRLGPKPGMAMPLGRRVSKRQAERRTGTQRTPRRVKARSISRACHSNLSMKSATCGPLPAGAGKGARFVSSKGGIKKFLRNLSRPERLAAVHRCHQRDRRAEQHGVDLVEVEIERLEDFREWPAVIARIRARQSLGKFARRIGGACHEKMCHAAVD